MLNPRFLSLAISFLALGRALANDWVHTFDFGDHKKIAQLAAPHWYFDFDEGCYPSSAFYANGEQTKPGWGYLDSTDGHMVYKGCAPETTTDKANPFPTYYRVRYCDYGDHQEYHVLYDVFFPFSTNANYGHEYDWEWAVVKWKRVPGNPDYWMRDRIVLAAHGDKSEKQWGDYPNTDSDSDGTWRRNAENPIIKFGIYGHGLEDSMAGAAKSYRASEWLVDSVGFPRYSWGRADSPPNEFEANGSRDICWQV